MSDTATQFTVPAVTAAVAGTIPDRELIIQGERRYSYADIVERSNRLASYLHSRGLGCHTERSALAGHEVGQDLMGLYAYNGNEFVEALLGAFAARVAPFNVNFRYVKSELQYLLADSGATVLIYHAAFGQRVARRRRGLRDRHQLGVVGAAGTALAGRFVCPLHRWHDWHAQRCVVASA
jgi:acyl-CoA synthetase (AMP-forming)/AMP-acid ligase II